MDYTYPQSAETFRREVRDWLDKNLPADMRGVYNRGDIIPADLARLKAWNNKMADARYVAISWPEQFGGRNAGVMEQVVLAEEMHRAGAPAPLNPIGINNIAPSIMAYGTEEQKQKYLKRMLSGEDIWCQGFSEPDAGSDLASLRTRATEDGDCFVINGQKVWNTLGHYADYCELLVRTDPAATKHNGISCLLIDMKTPGIAVRPLKTITGAQEFAEIFFDNVRVPRSTLLGPLHQGWMVAMNTLSNERAGVASLHLGVRKKVSDLIAEAKKRRVDGKPLSADPVVRQKLAKAYLMGEMQKAIGDVTIAAASNGKPPGAESSIIKIAWGEVEDLIAETSAQVLGTDALLDRWGDNRLYTRATSVAGGTTQVNRNIVAQRVLGLPRDGKPRDQQSKERAGDKK
jgi:alkylation response protein AidB-like acyl-CoA dehydrogenase